MKYCEEYAALLDLFVDGELPTGELERVRAHLETCPGCQGYVDDALAIRAGFPGVEDAAAPDGFIAGVMERVREDAGKDMKRRKRRAAQRWLGTFAALAACCALIILVRTGPGGLSGGGASVVTVSGGSGASAGYAMDTGGAAESDGAGFDPQMAKEPAAAPEEGEPEEGAEKIEDEARMARAETDRPEAMDRGDAEELERAADFSEYSGYEEIAVSPTAALPEVPADAAGSEGAALYLTAEEAGELLEKYTPVREITTVLNDALASTERWYELTGEEYQSLLEALGRPAETAAAPVLVVVTEPLE